MNTHPLLSPDPLLPVTDADTGQLGNIKHALGRPPAHAHPITPPPPAAQEPTSPLPPLLPLRDNFYNGIDHAFSEAFSARMETGSEELVAQAQEATRQCMAELLNGNTLMRISPEKMAQLQQDIDKLTTEIVHEALSLAKQYSPDPTGKSTRTTRRPPDIRRAIQEELKALRPVQEFKFKYLGYSARLEHERELGASPEKATQ